MNSQGEMIWKRNMSPYHDFVESPKFYNYSLCKSPDNSGYVMASEWHTPLVNEVDYGLLFKVSEEGDSLWTRKYHPLSWDSLRTGYIQFYQMNYTPYNSIVVVGIVADRESG